MAHSFTLLTILALTALAQEAAPGAKRAVEVECPAGDSFRDPLPGDAVARFGTRRMRPGGTIALAYSPKGDIVAAGCGSRILCWDVNTGKPLRPIEVGASLCVWGLTFFPDGKRLAARVSSKENERKSFKVIVLNLNGETIRSAPSVSDNVTGVIAVSPNGKWLAFEDEKDRLRVWDYANDQTALSLALQLKNKIPQHLADVVFSPNGKYLAVAHAGLGSNRSEYPIVLYDLKSGEVVARLLGHRSEILSLSFSAKGDLLLSGGRDMTLRVWDVSKRKQIVCIEEAVWATKAVLSPDGRLAASLSAGLPHRVTLWDTRTGKSVREIPIWALFLAFSPDGKRIATGGDCVSIWDVTTGKDALELPGHTSAITSIAFSPNGKLLASQGCDKTVRLWDMARGTQIHVLAAGDPKQYGGGMFPGTGISFSPDGSMVAAVSTLPPDPKVRVWGTDRGNLIKDWEVPDALPRAAAFLPDGKTLATLTTYGISLWAMPGASKLKAFSIDSDPNAWKMARDYTSLAVSPDRRTLATTQSDWLLRISDYTTGRIIFEIKAPHGEAFDLAYSPDGRILAVGGSSGNGAHSPGSIFLWEAATGRPLGTIGDRKTGAVERCAFSPDGRLMATGDEKENIVRVFNVFTGKELTKFRGHSAPVTCLAFSPDGQRLASGSFDTTILLWDVSKLDRSLPQWQPTPKELDSLVEKLQGDDGPAAFQAVGRLAAVGDAAVTLLRPRLRPVAIPDAKRIARLLADLDASDFEVRETASRELGTLGRQVEPDLRKLLDGKPSAEVRKRVETLLAACDAPPSAKEVKELRGVWVLEEVGTASARKCLDELAKGAPGARVTQEAKRAVDRLQRREAKK